jgi:(R,R)-butanediol dehydrogenase / meso-butanediol dehydrogenase / diacetyl reductase
MKAAVYREGRLFVEDIAIPSPEPNEIVMKVAYCAICGSDLHRYAYSMMNEGTIMGHEFSGVVVQLGENVKKWKIGDRVTRCGGKVVPGRDLPNFPPRFSAQERGFLPQKPGAYAEYMATDEEKVMPIPNEVSDLHSSLVEPLNVAVHAVRASKLKLGDKAVVLGVGPIGLFVQQCASLAGASTVYVSDVNPARLKVAEILGADGTFNPEHTDIVKEIVNKTEIGPDVAFECAGAKSTLQDAMNMVRMGGQAVVVSLAWEPVHCLPVEWVGREVELRSCYGHLNSEWLISMTLMKEKHVKVEPMISKVINLDQIDEAFRELLAKDNKLIQVVVKCSNEQ